MDAKQIDALRVAAGVCRHCGGPVPCWSDLGDVAVGRRHRRRRSAASILGSRGGRAGTGEAKRRGDSTYYSRLGLRRLVRDYVIQQYASRRGRDVRIGQDGAVTILLDGDGSQMLGGVDQTSGRYMAGWLDDLAREAREDR